MHESASVQMVEAVGDATDQGDGRFVVKQLCALAACFQTRAALSKRIAVGATALDKKEENLGNKKIRSCRKCTHQSQ